MNWNGKELETIGDLMYVITDIARADDQDAADRFMALYRAENEHADANVGYLSGYCSPETMAKIQRMFKATHPIFGSAIPSAVDAFAAGKSHAR